MLLERRNGHLTTGCKAAHDIQERPYLSSLNQTAPEGQERRAKRILSVAVLASQSEIAPEVYDSFWYQVFHCELLKN